MSQTLHICGSCLSRPKNENKKKTENEQRHKIFLRRLSWFGAAIKFFCSTRLTSSMFYCLPTEDMEGLRKVFNALEIENNDILQPYFHDYRKDFESVVFVEEEFLCKRIQKEDMFVDLTLKP